MSTASDAESVADSDFVPGSIGGSGMEIDLTAAMFPLVATYVVLSIDPVATLASLDDPEVVAATNALHPKKYVGYVRNVGTLYFRLSSRLKASPPKLSVPDLCKRPIDAHVKKVQVTSPLF
jgi:hypothetical protein